MDVREKLVELLWEYDQMRMMRMSIEECADRLIPKGLTVRKCENDTKCSDLAICLDENAKEKTERIVDLMTSFYGVDPGYYGVEAYPLALHLIANGVTVQEWISVSEPPKERGCYLVSVKHWLDGKPVTREAKWNGADWLSCYKAEEITPRVTHWLPLPQPPKG